MFMLYIEDVGNSKHNKYVDDTVDYIVKELNGQFLGVIPMVKASNKFIKPRPIYIWMKTQ